MAGRGGRGGGRGGGAAGRGGGLFSTGSSLMGGISYNDVMEGSKLAAEAKLYPVRHTSTLFAALLVLMVVVLSFIWPPNFFAHHSKHLYLTFKNRRTENRGVKST